MRSPFAAPAEKPEDTLTPRQFQVSSLIAQGMSNRGIAEACSITVDTVKRHVQDAMEKTGCENRTALAVWFLDRFPTQEHAQVAYRKAIHFSYAAKFTVAENFYPASVR